MFLLNFCIFLFLKIIHVNVWNAWNVRMLTQHFMSIIARSTSSCKLVECSMRNFEIVIPICDTVCVEFAWSSIMFGYVWDIVATSIQATDLTTFALAMLKAVCGFCNREGAFVTNPFLGFQLLATWGPESSRRRRVAGAQQKKKIAEGIPFSCGIGTWRFFWKAICSAYTDTVIPKESRANASWGWFTTKLGPFSHPRISLKYWPLCPFFGEFACNFFEYLSWLLTCSPCGS